MEGERGKRERGKGGRGEGIGRWVGGEGEGEEGKGALMPACLVSKTVTCRPPTSALPIRLPTTQPTSLAKPGSLTASLSESLVRTVVSC